jgi:dephospho-CoA kinase
LHLFGLTGGIASGKSTVAARLRARGLPVIDADELAREVVAPKTATIVAIADAFGAGVIQSSGALDRKALAHIVFSDPVARSRLNAIIHPVITQRALERASELGASGHPLVCYEAALIVENGSEDRYRPLVVVACPTPIQVARIRARDALSEQEALSRIRAQKPLAEKVAMADHVVDTTGPLETTARRTDDVLHAICLQMAVDPDRYFSA